MAESEILTAILIVALVLAKAMRRSKKVPPINAARPCTGAERRTENAKEVWR